MVVIMIAAEVTVTTEMIVAEMIEGDSIKDVMVAIEGKITTYLLF